MHLSHLHILRQASEGGPSMREIARRMKVSAEVIRRFEGGEQPLSVEREKAYALALGATHAQVRRMFQLSAIAYHKRKLAEITIELRTGKTTRRRA